MAVPALWPWQSSLSHQVRWCSGTPSNECNYSMAIPQCCQLHTLLTWLKSKLSGFSNNKFTFSQWWFFSETIGKVREYISFEDYLQRFVPEKPRQEQHCPIWGQSPPTPLRWHSHWPILRCQDVGLNIGASSDMCNYVVPFLCHHIMYYNSIAYALPDHDGLF